MSRQMFGRHRPSSTRTNDTDLCLEKNVLFGKNNEVVTLRPFSFDRHRRQGITETLINLRLGIIIHITHRYQEAEHHPQGIEMNPFPKIKIADLPCG